MEESMEESSKANGEEITEKSTKEDAEEGAPDYPFHPLVIAAHAIIKRESLQSIRRTGWKAFCILFKH